MGLIMVCTVPFFMFVIGVILNVNIIYSAIGWILGLVVMIVIFQRLTAHPLNSLIEGKGFLCISISSNGIIDMFLLTTRPPYVENKERGIKTLYDRAKVFYMHAPKDADITEIKRGLVDKPIKHNKKAFLISYDKDDETGITYAFKQYPCMIWNASTKAFLSKDFLNSGELSNELMHMVQHIRDTTEDLNNNMRDFGRYAVELTRPKGKLWENKIFLLMMGLFVLFVVIMGIMFLPDLIGGLSTSLKMP